MLQTVISFTGRGILNHECRVLTPCINVVARLDDVTAIAISPFLLTSARIKLVTNAFPVPLGASMKITEEMLLCKHLHTIIYCSLLIIQ